MRNITSATLLSAFMAFANTASAQPASAPIMPIVNCPAELSPQQCEERARGVARLVGADAMVMHERRGTNEARGFMMGVDGKRREIGTP